MAVPWTWIAVVSFIACYLLHGLTKKSKKLPPGPRGVPILGHLHMLGNNPHQDLLSLAKKHGPIMFLKFGFVPHIVVSSPGAAEHFLKTHDLVFASRPPNQASKYIAWEQRNIKFSPYGDYWRNMRKLCTLEMLSSNKISSFKPTRNEELGLFIESIKMSARECVAVDLSAEISSLAGNLSCRMVFGKKYDDADIYEGGLKGLAHETVKIAAAPNLGEFFPFLGILDLQGLTRKMKVLAKVCDDFLEKVIDDHVRGGQQGKTKDLVDTMLSIMQSGQNDQLQLDRRHVKAVSLDILLASMDTTATTVEWIMSELLKNPWILKKVQKELEEVVGLERMVEESDLEKLDYLYMVVKEAYRLHPVAPLLLPHYSVEDCCVDGYDIPKGSKILVNTYAIGRDPTTWTDPDKFIPERFIRSGIDLKGKHFELLPFGSGRRGCPGMQLGLIHVQLITAQLVHCFDWQLPNDMSPEELDMAEEFGLTVTRLNSLLAVPTFRLH